MNLCFRNLVLVILFDAPQVTSITLLLQMMCSLALSHGITCHQCQEHLTFKNTWLARCPCPEWVVTDDGPEISEHEWEFMLMDWGIGKGPISLHVLSANAVVQSSQKSIGQILRTVPHDTAVNNVRKLEASADNTIAMANCDVCCVSHTSSQGMAPGVPVFGCNVNVNISFTVDMVAISANWQLSSDAHLLRENQQCIWHECTVSDNVCVNNHHLPVEKLSPEWVGPFPVPHVHINESVAVQRGQIHEQISICSVKSATGLWSHIG